MGIFLTAKSGPLIDARSSTDSHLHRCSRPVEKSGKAAETSDGDLICHVFSLDNVVAHFTTSNHSGNLSIDKPDHRLVAQL